jgi:hypothetical protein
MRGIDIVIEERRKLENKTLELFQTEIERLEYENDTFKAFIIDMWNADPDERFNVLWNANNYLKQLNKPK